MLELAMQMLTCLLIAGLLGGIIGYLLGRISKCDEQDTQAHAPLNDYAQKQEKLKIHQEVFVPMDNSTLKRTHKGTKPISLSAPHGGTEDDLKEISGIGIKVENALFELGIFHFSQLAQLSKANITWLEDYFATEGRIEREEWVAQAKELMLKKK